MNDKTIADGRIWCPNCRTRFHYIVEVEENIQSQEKKDVGTLSNPLSGDTKQGGIKSQDDTKLQIERSASLLADNHPDTNIKQSTKSEILKDYSPNEIKEAIMTCKRYSNAGSDNLIDVNELKKKFVKSEKDDGGKA